MGITCPEINTPKDFRINILENFRVKIIRQSIVRYYNSSVLVFISTSHPHYNGDEICCTSAFPGQHPKTREHVKGTASFLLPGWSLWCTKPSAYSQSQASINGKDISPWSPEVTLSIEAFMNPIPEPYLILWAIRAPKS